MYCNTLGDAVYAPPGLRVADDISLTTGASCLLDGYKFRRQQPIGLYIVDFVSFEGRVVIELAGGQHSQQMDYDSKRTAWLEAQGYQVLRFWNNQVLKEIEAVKAIVSKVLEDGVNTPHLNPPPQGGRRLVPSPSTGEG